MDAIVAGLGGSGFDAIQRGREGNIAAKIFTPLKTRADPGTAQVPVFNLPGGCALQAAVAVIVKGEEIGFLSFDPAQSRPSGCGQFKFYNLAAIGSGFALIVAAHIKTAANAELFSCD